MHLYETKIPETLQSDGHALNEAVERPTIKSTLDTQGYVINEMYALITKLEEQLDPILEDRLQGYGESKEQEVRDSSKIITAVEISNDRLREVNIRLNTILNNITL